MQGLGSVYVGAGLLCALVELLGLGGVDDGECKAQWLRFQQEVITDASDAVRNMAIVDEIYQKMGLAPRQGIFHGEPSLLHTSPRESTHGHSLSYESSGNKTQFSVEDEPPFGATQVTNGQHVELDQSSPVMKEASESDLDVRAHTEASSGESILNLN